MSEDKKSKSVWGIVLKVIITVATAIAGALGSRRLQVAMRTITLLIVHCSATPQGVALGFEDCRRDHIRHRGFRDIGYHFYRDPRRRNTPRPPVGKNRCALPQSQPPLHRHLL